MVRVTVFSRKQKNVKHADPDAYVWVIGVDSDQYEEGKVGDDNITLTSMLKRVDLAVMKTAELAAKGKFPGGEITRYGLADDGSLTCRFTRCNSTRCSRQNGRVCKRKLLREKLKFQKNRKNKELYIGL